MSTIYSQSTISSVFVGKTGHAHEKEDPSSDEPFALDCVACEPHLVREGWVYKPEQVPLTEAQEREQERLEREGNIAVKQAAEALATAAAAQLTGTEPKTTRRRTTKSTTAA